MSPSSIRKFFSLSFCQMHHRFNCFRIQVIESFSCKISVKLTYWYLIKILTDFDHREYYHQHWYCHGAAVAVVYWFDVVMPLAVARSHLYWPADDVMKLVAVVDQRSLSSMVAVDVMDAFVAVAYLPDVVEHAADDVAVVDVSDASSNLKFFF